MSELRTNRIIPRDGIPSGSNGGIIQVVQVVKTDAESLTSNNTEQLIPGMEATITPTRSDSKVLVQVVLHASVGGSFAAHYAVLRRGSTNICIGDAGNVNQARATLSLQSPNHYSDNHSNLYGPGQSCINFLDSPATTSAVTYGLYHADGSSGATNALYINRSIGNDQSYYNRVASTITLMEVSG
jgi:hypothetical protein